MIAEEELIQLREENTLLREQVDVQKKLIKQQQEHIDWLEKQGHLQEQQMKALTEQVKALQERLSKDSHNSHLPPSSDRFVRQPKSLRNKSGKKPGGQQGHQGSTLQMSTQPDEVIRQVVGCCQHCQQDLQAVVPHAIERRQVVDLAPVHLLVREYQAEQKQCPDCQRTTVAPFPQTVQAPVQYGPSIGAIAVYLVQQHLLPLARACEIMEDLLGVRLCEGTLCSLIARCAQQLADVEGQIKQALVQAAVIHQDETGLYVGGKRHWMHVTSTPTLTHYHVHAS